MSPQIRTVRPAATRPDPRGDIPMDPYERGIQAYVQGDMALARKLFAEAPDDGRAWGMLGQMASEGSGEPENPAKAAGLYAEAARRGDASGAYNLAALYATGRGVPKDFPTALAWYRYAADLGDTDAVRMVGVMYANGEGVPADPAEARRWWQRAADTGDPGAMELLGRSLGGDPDPVPAFEWLLKSAQAGNREARPLLRAMGDRLRAAAEAGNTRAQALFGNHNLGYLDDPAEAVRWLTPAAAVGDPEAQCNLGLLLLQGKGIEPDPERGLRLLDAAARAGFPMAAYNLGVLHLKGRNVPQDPALAEQWFRIAAQAGYAAAYPPLTGLLRDRGAADEAMRWAVEGARNGHVGCMWIAATGYRHGTGTAVDLVESLHWYLAMLDKGDGDGLHEAHGIVPQMSAEQIREAARRAGQPEYGETFLRLRGDA